MRQPPSEPMSMSLAQAARELQITVKTATTLIEKGEFPVPVHKVGHQWRLSRRALQDFLDGKEPVR